FPLLGKNGSLLPHFLFVSNVKTKNPAVIRAGNERVLRARLEDARFYFEQDKKQRLEDRAGQLTGLVFHEKLGTVHQKAERIRRLATLLVQAAGKEKDVIDRVERAALLCKADLLTGMVREFPTLQGIIGREYAKLQDEDPEVAEAIAEHYFPRQADDPYPPKTITGKFLTAADHLDTLVGFFGVDLAPSGSLDPYALRRRGMGLITVMLDEVFAKVGLRYMIKTARALYSEMNIHLKKDIPTLSDEIERLLAQRMETYLKRRFETGYRADLADAVLCRPFDRPLDLYLRFVALTTFQSQPDFEPLIVTFKRASRILPSGFQGEIHPEAFKETVEKELYQSYLKAETQAGQFLSRREYREVLKALADLRRPIDAFFDGVMVMDEDRSVRENRLALLQGITKLFAEFGDFTRVMVEEKNKQ
ncbi:MAG: glycine--tRNA ligase subunit beta, partial [Nitrospirae bacterium]|nr:glycine--tRNA ligase subunit beta [Nitrospirota bacterium]